MKLKSKISLVYIYSFPSKPQFLRDDPSFLPDDFGPPTHTEVLKDFASHLLQRFCLGLDTRCLKMRNPKVSMVFYSKMFVPDLPDLGVFPFWDILGNLHIVLRPEFKANSKIRKGINPLMVYHFPTHLSKGPQEQCYNT